MKGCSSFSTSDTLNFVTVLTAATATIFFVVGCVGYSDQRAAIKHTCWFSASYTGGLSADFGLSSVYAKDREFLFSFDYGGASCKADFCERCHSDGIAALGLLIAALATAGISALMSAFLCCSPAVHPGVQILNVVCTAISASVSLIGAGNFMRECYRLVDNDIQTTHLKWGPGSIITFTGMALMWVAVVLQVSATLLGTDDSVSRPGSSKVPPESSRV
jgi:hypothetical protein